MLRRRAPYGQKFPVPVLLLATAPGIMPVYISYKGPTYLTGYRGGSRVFAFRHESLVVPLLDIVLTA
jgi:hypothetical protein